MAGPAAALAPILKSLAKQQAMSALARRGNKDGGGGGGGLKVILFVPLALLMAIVVALGSCGQAVNCDPGSGSSPDGGPVPGSWDGPGSLGGVLGTGVSPAELRKARVTPASGPKVTAGEYRSTAYAPVAGGVNCDTAGKCTHTSSGIRVDQGQAKKYLIASNPRLLQYGNLVYVWPNPYSWKGPFVVADTGGDFQGAGRLDFYTFEPGSLSKALAWGNQKMVKVSRKPIVSGGPTEAERSDGGTGTAQSTSRDAEPSGDPQKMLRPSATGQFTSPFGPRWGRLHAGVDIGIPVGTPIVAVLDGKVVQAGPLGGYGNYLCIAHAGNLTTCNGHLSQILARNGKTVKRGQKVALSGNTGSSTGPHLHFEVRIGQTASAPPVNPAPYLSGAQTVDPGAAPVADEGADEGGNEQCVCRVNEAQTANASNPSGPVGALPASVPAPYRELFVRASQAAGIDPALLASIFYYGENGKNWPNPKGPWASSNKGAQGPFQFLPSTWRGYARDGNNDGKKDIQNLEDAAYGAAAYLAANGGKKGASEANIRKAIFAYNRADWYVNLVYNGIRDLQGNASDQAATADSADPNCGGEEGSVEVGTAAANGWDLEGDHAMVSYNQGDPRWAGKPYGSSTIGPAGCGPTSVAMVLATLTKRGFTPESVARRYRRFYVPGAGSSWGLFTTAFQENGLTSRNLGTNIEGLRDTIRKGGLGIISVDPGHFTGAGHIMVIRGMNEDGTKWFINDPNGKGKRGDSETKSFSTEFLRSTGAMKNIWAISK